MTVNIQIWSEVDNNAVMITEPPLSDEGLMKIQCNQIGRGLMS